MNQTTVAERFNAASESLDRKGHRVIVRRARLLLEGGKAEEAVSFLEDAGRRMRGMGVDSLAADLRRWREAGGDAGALVTDPEWVKGAASDHLRARVINQTTHDASLNDLVDALAEQHRALAKGEPLAGPPSGRVAPDQLPPLPRMGMVRKKDRAPVKQTTEEPRVIDAADNGHALAQVNVERTPRPAATSDDVLKLVSQPVEEFPVVPPAMAVASQPPAEIIVDEVIELSPSPIPDVKAPAPAETSSSSPLLAVGAIVLAAIAAGVYFMTR